MVEQADAEMEDEEVDFRLTFFRAMGKVEADAVDVMNSVLRDAQEKGGELWLEGQPPRKWPRNELTSPIAQCTGGRVTSTQVAACQIAQCIERALFFFHYQGSRIYHLRRNPEEFVTESDQQATNAVDALSELSKAIEINCGTEVCEPSMLKESKMKVIDAATFRIQYAAGLQLGNKEAYYAALMRAHGGTIGPERESIMYASYRRAIWVPFQRFFPPWRRGAPRPRRARTLSPERL